MTDPNEEFTPSPDLEDIIVMWAPRLAVALVLITMAVLVGLAILSFIGKPLDDRHPIDIKKAADAAANSGE